MYSCTKLTSLAIFDLTMHVALTALCNAGGLSDAMTALQRLARLRLQDVLTAPLTNAVSGLTKLTSIGLRSGDYAVFTQASGRASLLPDGAAALTGIEQLDIDGFTLPPAVQALTGMDHDVS